VVTCNEIKSSVNLSLQGTVQEKPLNNMNAGSPSTWYKLRGPNSPTPQILYIDNLYLKVFNENYFRSLFFVDPLARHPLLTAPSGIKIAFRNWVLYSFGEKTILVWI